ncbi:MAG TPA: ABC transporter ATP-binding protein [Xanthobacteraceae bacterium]|jgi:ABC-type branched-subunit amino acid transport system ATPase component
MSALLCVAGVSRRFGGYLALDEVSCDVAARHIHALIGPNGAGKTTLFNIISGTLTATSGHVVFDGHDYTGRRPDRVLKMGIARNFQHVRLIRGLSIVENVMIGCHTSIDRGALGNTAALLGLAEGERAAVEKARELLDFVGVHHKRQAEPLELTLGDQRRVEIARALAGNPRLLLLDEPAAGMNPAELNELRSLLLRIRAAGITVLLVEHHVRLIMEIADNVTVLNAGSVIAGGPPSVVQRDPAVISAYLGKSVEPAFDS